MGVEVPCAATTITCHACGAETRWDAARYLSHRCECGAIWDQDHNASVNILRAAESMCRSGEALEAEKSKGGGRFQGRYQKRAAAKGR